MGLRFRGVLFDLFGTLVPVFSMPAHTEAIRRCAGCLHVPFEELRRRWNDPGAGRLRGRFPSIAANLAWAAEDAGYRASAAEIVRAEEAYESFTVAALQPLPGALDVLRWFRDRGARIGLVTNCAPDVPKLWRRTALANCFDACIFSCEVNVMKPSVEIYRMALVAISRSAEETLYVGDGSDQELSAARRSGLHPVLVRTDASRAYDARRPDREVWTGPEVPSIADLPALVTSWQA